MTDHCREDALKDGSENIEDIAEEPYDDELNRESLGAAPLEVLEDLRGEDDDWELRVSKTIVNESLSSPDQVRPTPAGNRD